MNTYSESLFDRCKYLERENEKLKTALTDVCAEKDNYINTLRIDLNAARELMDRDEEFSRLWRFQGDGYDYIRSMASDLPVLILASELRHLVENGETVAEENGSAPIISMKPRLSDKQRESMTQAIAMLKVFEQHKLASQLEADFTSQKDG